MRKMKSIFLILVLVMTGCAAWTSQGDNADSIKASSAYTYADLANRLIDLDHLAVLPQPGEKCAQFSSYDRKSQYDAATGKYVGWDANGDGSGVIRKEGDTQVLAEMNGPGCIWRIWSAAPQEGHVRIFLDGSEKPAVDLPFIGYFNGEHAPFNRSSLVYHTPGDVKRGAGFNAYVPIPFQKSCKIVADPGWGRFYHFTYSTFPEGTKVPTFTQNLSPESNAALDAVDQFLSNKLGTDPRGNRPGEENIECAITVRPNQALPVAKVSGPRSITALRVGLPASADAETLRAFLREAILKIRWDGETNPSVDVPLGDFFGSSPGVAPYKSLPISMTTETLSSYWAMPFAKSAEIEITNQGRATVPLTFQITHAPLSTPIESLGRFHAKWHRDAFLPSDPDRKIDWTLLSTRGRGRLCGVFLHVWNPFGGWWGEGDEKFFVDGEKFPSTFGTGSEDYFGYAWCAPALFQAAFHNQPYNDGKNRGQIAVNRWQVADNVPFQNSFEGYLEKYFPNEKRGTHFAATVYWYLDPKGEDLYVSLTKSGLRDYMVEPKAYRLPGVLEAEELKTLETTGGKAPELVMAQWGLDRWSNNRQIFWSRAERGQRLTLALPVSKTGRYDVKIALTKAADYAIVQPYLDGQKAGNPIDLYNPEVAPAPVASLGTHQLTQGEHKLTLEIINANPKAVAGRFYAGIDYVKLEPAE